MRLIAWLPNLGDRKLSLSKPITLLLGLKNSEPEQLNLQLSAQFWEMMSNRRKRPTVSLSVVEAQLEELE